MLDYISNQLKARMGTPDPATDSETQMNEAVLEYAHLFQELDDLSMKGTSAGSSRPYTKIDIPLEDDIEIDSVELNLLDGRVTNVPMDATVQEAELALEYAGMKTYEQIYMETYSHMSQHMRETEAAYKERVTEAAQKAYQEYQAYIVQEGLFGFDKIDINDPRVPERLTIDFGEHPERGTYYVKVPVLFQVDKKHRILKKQLETSQILQNHRDIGVALRQFIFNTRKDEFGFEKPYDIWDKLTPLHVVIPVEPKDQYFAAWIFEVEGSDKKIVIEWGMPIKSKSSHNITDQKLLRAADSDFGKLNAITKRQGIQEMAVPTKAPSRFFQEAIDFGNPDEAPAGDASAPDVSVDAAPPADGQAQDAGVDTTAGADVTMTDDSGADANTEAIETNDVSDQIAEKVVDDTKKDATDSNDVNIDDLMDENNGDADMTDASADQPTDDEISADLGEDTASVEDTATDTSNLDFDNMTIDELLAQGTEKLKGMTIQQLKDFMTSGDTGAELSEEEVAQEAFFLTRSNIGKELDIHLRKTMGVLNDSDKDLNEICSEFRKEGKKLNRVVHKAAGMKKVFNDDERKHMARLNHVLVDLMAVMHGEIEESATSTVKRLIQAFVSEATTVAQIVESKNPKTVQEAYYPHTHDFSSIEKLIGRTLPEGYKLLINLGIENIGIKGANGLFQGCVWEILKSTLRDRDKYDYDGQPGSKFIPIANNGRGDEILMGNESKTDTRIFTYIHDVKNGLKQIAKNWDEFEKLLYTIKESDSKHDTIKIKFFGRDSSVRIERGISLSDTFTAIKFANNCDKYLNDNVRKQILKYIELIKSEMTDKEIRSINQKNPEKHLAPAYIYVNRDTERAPRKDGRYDWTVMLDCTFDFDNEHGLAILFDKNMNFKNVGPAGNYL